MKNILKAIVLISAALFWNACNNNNPTVENPNTEQEETPASNQATSIAIPEPEKLPELNSFVVSCGSGCAQRFENLSHILVGEEHILDFDAIMFINGDEGEKSSITYRIVCDGNRIKSIKESNSEVNELDETLPQFLDALQQICNPDTGEIKSEDSSQSSPVRCVDKDIPEQYLFTSKCLVKVGNIDFEDAYSYALNEKGYDDYLPEKIPDPGSIFEIAGATVSVEEVKKDNRTDSLKFHLDFAGGEDDIFIYSVEDSLFLEVINAPD